MKNARFLFAGSLSLILFVLVTGLVVTKTTQTVDANLAVAINRGLGPAFSQLMVWATQYGREYFWTAIVAVMLIFGKRETKLLALELAALFVCGIIAGEVLKILIFRERPFHVLSSITLRVPPDTDSSFPSGHAVIVSIGAVFVLATFRNKLAALLLTIEAAVVCYSRVYVGAHYPMDVLGGILVGTTVVFLGLFVFRNYLSKLFDYVGNVFVRLFRSLHIPEVL